MAKNEHIAVKANPDDPDDFDVSITGLAGALADREARRAKIGRPAGSNKEQIALRLDKDVLEQWRASGAGWQSRMGNVLRKAAP